MIEKINRIKLAIPQMWESRLSMKLVNIDGQEYYCFNGEYYCFSILNFKNGSFVVVETAENEEEARLGHFEDSWSYSADMEINEMLSLMENDIRNS